jgi:hypothetical protein
MVKRSERSKPPKQFGMFYPRGYVVLAFGSQDDAEQVRQALLDGGYDEDDVHVMDTARVLKGSSGDLEHLSPLIKALGSESDILESHRAGATAGQTFLIAYAPSDLDTQRLMNVARRVGYLSAQKYDRFTFTKL